jgi:hypothetical protein
VRQTLFENKSLSHPGALNDPAHPVAKAGPSFKLLPGQMQEMDGSNQMRKKKFDAGFTPRSARDQMKNGHRDTNAVKSLRAAAKRVRRACGQHQGRRTGTLGEMAALLRSQDSVFEDIQRVRYAPCLRRWALTKHVATLRFEAYFMDGLRSLVPESVLRDPLCPVTPVILVGDSGFRGRFRGFGDCSFKGPRPGTNRLVRLAARVFLVILQDEFRSTRCCLYCGGDNLYAQRKNAAGKMVDNAGVVYCRGSQLCMQPMNRDRKSGGAILGMMLARQQCATDGTAPPVVFRVGAFSRAAKLPWMVQRAKASDNFMHRCGGAQFGGNDHAPASNPGFHPLYLALKKHTVR